jgi:hypothetical protein
VPGMNVSINRINRKCPVANDPLLLHPAMVTPNTIPPVPVSTRR